MGASELDRLREQLRGEVRAALGGVGGAIKAWLDALLSTELMCDVDALHLEVFPDGFDRGVPVQAFWLDADNNEVFCRTPEGKWIPPSPARTSPRVRGTLVSTQRVDEYQALAPALPVLEVMGNECVEYLAGLVRTSGVSPKFRVTAGLHDEDAVVLCEASGGI